MNECAIILLGATGDLSKRKLFPALYQLFLQNKLDKFAIIGAALEAMSNAEFVEYIKKYAQPKDSNSWNEFVSRIVYIPLNFTQPKDFDLLRDAIVQQEKKFGLSGNRLIYCATAAYFYCTITKGVADSGIATRDENVRIVYEKPFGNDLDSAREINACIAQYFDESQIFRIDHYLSKELVSNIALVRFTNIIFEPLWNNRYIDQVHIIFDEKICLEGRGQFFDKYGAMADVMQNHMMQMLALIAMEAPAKLSGDYIRSERAKVLQHVQIVDTLLGQYEGYQNEEGVKPHSSTETFAQVYLEIKNPRWAGVPFYLRTGKCLNKKESAIYIKFKKIDCLLATCPSESNALAFHISPDSLFSLTLNTKKLGISDEVMPVKMQFCHGESADSPQAYELLFEEILRGEQAMSVRFDEIEHAWNIIQEIRDLTPPLYTYQKGSSGPQEAESFDRKHGIKWGRS